MFISRSFHIAVPLNLSEIVIMGGMNKNGQILSDVVLFNSKSLVCQKVADSEDYKFWSEDNSSAIFGNKILALVTFGYTNLIEFTLG